MRFDQDLEGIVWDGQEIPDPKGYARGILTAQMNLSTRETKIVATSPGREDRVIYRHNSTGRFWWTGCRDGIVYEKITHMKEPAGNYLNKKHELFHLKLNGEENKVYETLLPEDRELEFHCFGRDIGVKKVARLSMKNALAHLKALYREEDVYELSRIGFDGNEKHIFTGLNYNFAMNGGDTFIQENEKGSLFRKRHIIRNGLKKEKIKMAARYISQMNIKACASGFVVREDNMLYTYLPENFWSRLEFISLKEFQEWRAGSSFVGIQRMQLDNPSGQWTAWVYGLVDLASKYEEQVDVVIEPGWGMLSGTWEVFG